MTEPSATFLLFGATGDLAHRMIFPSLYNLLADGLLPDDFLIVASGRTEMDDDAFREDVDKALQKFLGPERYDAEIAARLRAMIGYQPVSAGNPEQFKTLAKRLDGRVERGVSVYLSTPPSLFAPTAQGLAEAGLITPKTRIAMEKPIGKDLASSKEVNNGIGALVDESQIFRVDHYLGKETVQNLLALRFGNVLFEPLWNTTAIDHVQITVGETVGLEGRVSYYDGVGALRDMVQNHVLQILSIIAMEPPARMDPTAVRDEKVKVLRSLRPMAAECVKTHSVRGQYTPGAVGGEMVTGYADELGKESDTETFVALKAHIDNWRWQGVPFYLRTGKRMPTRQSEIQIQFKPVRHSIFGRDGQGSGLERDVHLEEVTLDVSLTAAFAGQRRRIAYERLILDLLAGDQTLFVRRD
ncbi:MAG TPA: glucose-6-phosphate dehydrogenase, partial [Sphingobium sp.]